MKIFVGLSGGVDSAVSAALLKEQGHDVIGVFIKIYRPEFIECTWKEDRLDAIRVCAALGIPFREIDLSDEYKKGVVDTMIADYARGITPNPDVLCNREIKFGAFLTWALQNGAEKIATGHYARIDQEGSGYRLLRGRDPGKDQSYFLYRLTQKDLAHTLFPVGDLLKSEVRARAKALDLPVAQKHDSQGLCFIGDVSMEDFLRRYIDVLPGTVLDTSGNTIGIHQGAALMTIGQRHGLEIAGKEAGNALPAGRQAHYIVSINASANEIVVSPNRADAAASTVQLREVSWTARVPEDGARGEVQARYREKPITATLVHPKKNVVVRFSEPHIAAPGQSLVIYLPAQAGKGDVCMGGGVIEKAG